MGKQVYDYTDMLNNFSENMKRRRLKLGLRQKELAEIVGVSLKTIQNYENKKTIPTSAVMESISIALNISLNRMLGINELNSRKKSIDTLNKIDSLLLLINNAVEEIKEEMKSLR
jgi:DNA-binding helix-turn-helix protein